MKLLIIDDEPDFSELLSQRLKFMIASADIDICNQYYESIDRIDNNKYDIIISDIIINRFDNNLTGFDIVKFAKAKDKNTKCVLMSCLERPKRKDEVHDLFVIKPVNVKYLAEKIKEMINGR